MSLASLIQAAIDAGITEGVATMAYDEEADKQPFMERTHAAKVALESLTGEMLAALQASLVAAEALDVAPYGNAQVRAHFAAIEQARAAISKAGGQQ